MSFIKLKEERGTKYSLLFGYQKHVSALNFSIFSQLFKQQTMFTF
jgi:hypothetical protein